MGLFQDTLKDLHDSFGFPVGLNECVAQIDAVVDLMGQASDPLGQFSFYIFVGFAVIFACSGVFPMVSISFRFKSVLSWACALSNC